MVQWKAFNVGGNASGEWTAMALSKGVKKEITVSEFVFVSIIEIAIATE